MPSPFVDVDDEKRTSSPFVDVEDSSPRRKVSPDFEVATSRRSQPSSIKSLLPDFAIAGLPGAVAGSKRPEELLPAAGQLAGSPFGLPGEIAGATAGELGRQTIRGTVRGEGFDLKEVGKTAGVTAATAGLLKGAEKVIFRKELGAQALNVLGTQLGKMKNILVKAGEVDPGLSIPVDQVLEPLQKGFIDINVPFGQGATVVRKWIAKLNQFKEAGVGLGPRTLIELEDDLGSVAKFADKEIGGITIQPEVKKKAINKLIKDVRRRVSAKVDNLAANAGLEEYGSLSKKVSELKSRFPTSSLTRTNLPEALSQLGIAGGIGAAQALASDDPSKGLGLGALTLGVLNPQVRSLLFRYGVNTGASTGGRVAASELARNI